ncbi:MAG: hypothetical protein WBE46_07860 [Dehalococcoidia bacterium]
MKTFNSIRTVESRAVQIWQILVGLAYNRQTITYEKLSGLLGFKGAGTMGQFLDPIMRYCKLNGLPPLTVLVVGKYLGVPGEGLITVKDADLEREQVYDYDWFNIYPPDETEFAQALTAKL